MMYEIEKNIEIPEITVNTESKYPFKDMEVNDSFFIKAKDKKEANLFRNRLRGSAHMYGRRLGMKFITRTYDDGVRIWRIK